MAALAVIVVQHLVSNAESDRLFGERSLLARVEEALRNGVNNDTLSNTANSAICLLDNTETRNGRRQESVRRRTRRTVAV